MDPKTFRKAKASSVPICTNFEGGVLVEKTRFFWSKFSKKSLKTPFFGLFLKILPADQKFCPKQGLFNDLEELGKSIWST